MPEALCVLYYQYTQSLKCCLCCSIDSCERTNLHVTKLEDSLDEKNGNETVKNSNIQSHPYPQPAYIPHSLFLSETKIVSTVPSFLHNFIIIRLKCIKTCCFQASLSLWRTHTLLLLPTLVSAGKRKWRPFHVDESDKSTHWALVSPHNPEFKSLKSTYLSNLFKNSVIG